MYANFSELYRRVVMTSNTFMHLKSINARYLVDAAINGKAIIGRIVGYVGDYIIINIENKLYKVHYSKAYQP
jgi:hypothetical protein